MEKFATENLILLEFLVDRISLDTEVNENMCGMTGQTCVTFQFLDNAPLSVCEEDFAPKRNYSRDVGNLKNGKSCLFSLTPEQAQDCSKKFDVYVTILKKMKPGVLPEQIRIGETLVEITELFNELVESMSSATDDGPVAKTLKDCFKITNPLAEIVGDISVYIRMSCFGKLIVTQFQMNLDDKSVQFKAKEGHYLFKYNKKGAGGGGGGGGKCPTVPQVMPNVKNYLCPDEPCPSPNMSQHFPQKNLQCPEVPFPSGGGMNQMMQQQMMSQQMMQQQQQQQQMMMDPYAGTCMASETMMPQMGYSQLPPGYPGMPGANMYNMGNNNMGMYGGNIGMPGVNICEDPLQSTCLPTPPPTPQYSAPVPYTPPPDVPGNYQEIGAQMGPNALTIRVHKDSCKIERIDNNGQNGVGNNNGGDGGNCCCTIENFGMKQKRTQNRLSICEAPAGSCAEPQNLAMRPGIPTGMGAQQQPPFSFKMSGCGRATDNNVVVVPPCSTAPDGTKYTEISDPNRDVFILRIGKKSEGNDKKKNLELELCTPKGPDLKPLPKKETRDTQYDECDLPKPEKGGKGGKDGKGGKKGKGGGGKKGKGGKGGKKGGKKKK